MILLLVASLWLLLHAEDEPKLPLSIAHGVLLGLLTLGSPKAGALAVFQVAWLGWRPNRRRAAGVATVSGLLVVTIGLGFGLPLYLPSPYAIGPAAPLKMLQCSGASFTQIVGLAYYVIVPHSRHLVPLTLSLIGLLLLGARHVHSRPRSLLLGGLVLPFAVGQGLALSTDNLVPLQAVRLMGSLPFAALLVAAGVSSLRPWARWLAAALVPFTVAGFLVFALASEPKGTSLSRSLACEIDSCRPPEAHLVFARAMDGFAFAAWGVEGPMFLGYQPAESEWSAFWIDGTTVCFTGPAVNCSDAIQRCNLRRRR